MNYEVHLGRDARSMLVSKVYGRGDDIIKANDSIYLEGDYSSAL